MTVDAGLIEFLAGGAIGLAATVLIAWLALRFETKRERRPPPKSPLVVHLPEGSAIQSLTMNFHPTKH